MSAQLARESIKNLVAYSSARSLHLEANLFLDANESSEPPFGIGGAGLQRYPDPQPAQLIARLADLYNVSNESLVVGRGVDDMIDALVRAFCEAGRDSILISPPTYGMYKVCADIQGAQVLSVPTLRESHGFVTDLDAMHQACAPSTKLVFVCQPNNPTGHCVPPSQIETLCSKLEGKSLVVVDEAYIEFAKTPSLASQVSKHPNLVVLRTLSKARALAGARCGAGIFPQDIAEVVRKVIAPYPLSTPSIRVVMEALSTEGEQHTSMRIKGICQRREQLAARLKALASVTEVFPNEANFLLVACKNRDAVLRECQKRSVVMRPRSEAAIDDCIRVTVGDEHACDEVVDIFEEAR